MPLHAQTVWSTFSKTQSPYWTWLSVTLVKQNSLLSKVYVIFLWTYFHDMIWNTAVSWCQWVTGLLELPQHQNPNTKCMCVPKILWNMHNKNTKYHYKEWKAWQFIFNKIQTLFRSYKYIQWLKCISFHIACKQSMSLNETKELEWSESDLLNNGRVEKDK